MEPNDCSGKSNVLQKKSKDPKDQPGMTALNFGYTEEMYQSLFNHLNDEVHLWKLIRGQNGNIETWVLADANPAALSTWKKKKEEVTGKTADEIFGEGSTEQFFPIVKQIFNTGKPHKWVEYFEPTNQYLKMSSIPMGEYFVSTGKDITEEIELQKRL